MTKEQADELWQEICDCFDLGVECETEKMAGRMRQWQEAQDDSANAWDRMKAKYIAYTGHEVR